MATNTSDCSKQLENQMDDMCHYLEKLVTSDESGDDSNYHNIDGAHGFTGFSDFNKEQTRQAYIPGSFNDESYPSSSASDIPTPYSYGLVGASPRHALNTVTSVLANAPNVPSSTSRFGSSSTSYPRMKKRMFYKQSDKVPDTSNIDIDATMKELGLTPESLTQNKVHKLFSLFSNLEFSIQAEFITKSVYDQKTIPNTMSVSAQTKYAIWSSHKLLRSLREVLKRPMPAEYKSAFNKCEEALGELQQAIVKLDRFRHCTLEHRRGDFITEEADEYLQPLMDALNYLTACVEHSRMYIQVYERALNAPERYKAALLTNSGDQPQHVPEESYTETASCSRPEMARRYIG